MSTNPCPHSFARDQAETILPLPLPLFVEILVASLLGFKRVVFTENSCKMLAKSNNNNNNNVQDESLSGMVSSTAATGLAPVRTSSDKFMELVNILFEYTTALLSLPAIVIQEVINSFRSWQGVNTAHLEQLHGKVVLITGANSGIGECVAKYFYLAGCKLILAARRRNELERVRDSLLAMETTRKTHAPTVLELDLADSNSIASKAATAIATHGTIHILLNNAGVYNQGLVLDTVMDVDERIMAVNYLGTLALTKAVGRHMVKRREGHIAFVSSVLGKMTITNSLAYSASKHALQALADSLRAEVAPEGVNVTIVSPSYVNTAITLNALNSDGNKVGVVTKEVATGYSSEYVSERIFKAVVNQEADVTIAPLAHRAAIYLRNFFPSLFFVVARLYGRRFEKQH